MNPLRSALLRAIDEAAFPLLGGLAGATGGVALGENDASGALGGAMIGAMGGYGARQVLSRLARNALRPSLPADIRSPAMHIRDPEAQSMSRVQRRVADATRPLAQHTSRMLDDVNTLKGLPPVRMADVLESGQRGSDEMFDEYLGPYSARQDLDEDSAGSVLFGGAAFDPRRMRRAAGLGRQAEPLPSNPEDFKVLLDRYPSLKGKANKARAIIMYSARHPDGRPVYTMEQVLNATELPTMEALKGAMTYARKRLGIPIPDRPRSPAFDNRPPSDAAALEAARARLARIEAKRASHSEAAQQRYARAQGRAQDRAERAQLGEAIGVKKVFKLTRGQYNEADIVNEATTMNERGFYPKRADISASLRDDEGEGANIIGVQLDRLLKYADRAVAAGEPAVAILAKLWNVTPDRVRLFAQRPWRGNKLSTKNQARRLIAGGMTDARRLIAELRRDPSFRDSTDNSIEQTVYAALREAGLGKKARKPDALSIVLPYLVTGGVGAAISTVADREARRGAIMREMGA
jgi:hypothetical protein